MKEEEELGPRFRGARISGSVTRDRPDAAAEPAHGGRLGPGPVPGSARGGPTPTRTSQSPAPRFPGTPLLSVGVPQDPIAVLPRCRVAQQPPLAAGRPLPLPPASALGRPAASKGRVELFVGRPRTHPGP